MAESFDGRDLRLGHDLDPRRALDAVDEVLRHGRLQRLAAHHDAHAAGTRREVDRRLPRRVAAADDDHVLVAAALGVRRHGRVVDPRAAEAIDALGLQLPPASARGHHDRACDDVLPVVEVDAQHALRPVGELDRAMEARQHGIEAPRLERRLAGQVAAGDPDREAEVVLDARARPGLAAGRPGLRHERPQALRAAVDRGCETRRVQHPARRGRSARRRPLRATPASGRPALRRGCASPRSRARAPASPRAGCRASRAARRSPRPCPRRTSAPAAGCARAGRVPRRRVESHAARSAA